MKNNFKKTVAAFAAAALVAAFALTIAPKANAGGSYYGLVNPAVNSASQTFTNTTVPTNGLYTATILGNTSETNLVWLNKGGGNGNTLALQFVASATAAATATNIQFVLSYANSGYIQAFTNNQGTNVLPAYYSAPQTRQLFMTNTLTFNGTVNSTVTTNVLLSISSTPPFNGGMEVYLESIYYNGITTSYASNIQVYVSQQ